MSWVQFCEIFCDNLCQKYFYKKRGKQKIISNLIKTTTVLIYLRNRKEQKMLIRRTKVNKKKPQNIPEKITFSTATTHLQSEREREPRLNATPKNNYCSNLSSLFLSPSLLGFLQVNLNQETVILVIEWSDPYALLFFSEYITTETLLLLTVKHIKLRCLLINYLEQAVNMVAIDFCMSRVRPHKAQEWLMSSFDHTLAEQLLYLINSDS